MTASGRFIAVVGPSGVGKDSVMTAMAAAQPQLRLARRVITRPPDAGGEDFEGTPADEFARRAEQGDFALSWSAHGLSYGIPAEVDHDLAAGRDVLANLSRAVLGAAARRFDPFVVMSLSASPEALAARLAARGRESTQDITARLARRANPIPSGLAVLGLSNDGPLADTVDAALAQLYPDNDQRLST